MISSAIVMVAALPGSQRWPGRDAAQRSPPPASPLASATPSPQRPDVALPGEQAAGHADVVEHGPCHRRPPAGARRRCGSRPSRAGGPRDRTASAASQSSAGGRLHRQSEDGLARRPSRSATSPPPAIPPVARTSAAVRTVHVRAAAADTTAVTRRPSRSTCSIARRSGRARPRPEARGAERREQAHPGHARRDERASRTAPRGGAAAAPRERRGVVPDPSTAGSADAAARARHRVDRPWRSRRSPSRARPGRRTGGRSERR